MPRYVGNYLGQVAPIVVSPEQGENAFTKFMTVGRRIWSEPLPAAEYSAHGVVLSYGAQPPLNQSALVEYGKIAVVGMLAGVPLAFMLGRWSKG